MASSFLTGAVSKAVGAAMGQTPRNTLQTFLNGVSSAHSSGIKIKEPDPLNTFDVRFKFFPSLEAASTKKKGVLANVTSSLISSAKDAVRNAANNLTGGLLGSLMNKVDIQAEHDKFTTIKNQSECHSFLEYLAKANLLCGTEDTWLGGMGEISSPLEIDMTYFVQKITVPMLMMDGGVTDIDTNYVGKFKMNGTYITPDSHELQLTMLNTKVPVHERIFYPWMREVTLPYWSYATQPYTTATITIDLTSHADIKYVFIGCRPSKIETYQPDQALPTSMERQVTMVFDYMFVQSDMTTTESIGSKLTSLGTSLFNSAAKSLRL